MCISCFHKLMCTGINYPSLIINEVQYQLLHNFAQDLCKDDNAIISQVATFTHMKNQYDISFLLACKFFPVFKSY